MSGVILDYYLQEAVPDSVEMTLDILSASGEVIRSILTKNQKSDYPVERQPILSSLPRKGLNRFSWDMRTENFPACTGCAHLLGKLSRLYGCPW
jgi:hypothetical protein